MSELFNLFIRNIRIDWSKIEEYSYLREIPAFVNLKGLDFTRNITFLVGENGTGKSTLLEAVAVAYGFNPEGGTINYRFSTYDDVSELSTAIQMTKGFLRPEGSYFFRAESFFNVATKAEDYRDFSSLPFFRRFPGGGFILWTSLKQRCLRSAS